MAIDKRDIQGGCNHLTDKSKCLKSHPRAIISEPVTLKVGFPRETPINIAICRVMKFSQTRPMGSMCTLYPNHAEEQKATERLKTQGINKETAIGLTNTAAIGAEP